MNQVLAVDVMVCWRGEKGQSTLLSGFGAAAKSRTMPENNSRRVPFICQSAKAVRYLSPRTPLASTSDDLFLSISFSAETSRIFRHCQLPCTTGDLITDCIIKSGRCRDNDHEWAHVSIDEARGPQSHRAMRHWRGRNIR